MAIRSHATNGPERTKAMSSTGFDVGKVAANPIGASCAWRNTTAIPEATFRLQIGFSPQKRFPDKQANAQRVVSPDLSRQNGPPVALRPQTMDWSRQMGVKVEGEGYLSYFWLLKLNCDQSNFIHLVQTRPPCPPQCAPLSRMRPRRRRYNETRPTCLAFYLVFGGYYGMVAVW